MRSSKYIGRVGALAVALGIGAAVGSWPAIAFADPTGSETSTSPSDSTSEPAPDTTNAPETGSKTTDPVTATAEPATGGFEPSESSATTPDPRDGIVEASGGAEVRTGSDSKPEPKSEPKPDPKPDKPKNDPPEGDAVNTSPKPISTSNAQEIDLSAKTPTKSPEPEAVVPQLVNTLAPQSAPAAQHITPQIAGAAAAEIPAAEERDLIAAVTTGLAGVFNPLAADGEDVPVDSPLAWTVLAITRRWSAGSDDAEPIALPNGTEGNAVYNEDVAGTPTYGTPDTVTGAVTGSLNFTDADGDPLTYTYSGSSSKGALVVNTDGTFVYTPNQAARLGAYQTTGADFASFDVTASDGLTTATVTLAPPIAPGRLELTTPLTTSGRPSGVAVSPDGTRAYVAGYGDGEVLVVDTTTNVVLDRIALQPTGVSNATSVTVNPDGSRVYVTNGNGGLSVINTANNTILQTIPTPFGPVRMAISPDGARGYITNDANDSVDVVDLSTNTFVTSITDINTPFDVLVGRDGTRVYATTIGNGPASIKVIDTSTNSVIETVIVRSAQGYPALLHGLATSLDGTRLYTANVWEGKLLTLNTADNSVVDSISGFNVPTALGLSPDGSLAYLANQDDGTVSAVDIATHSIVGTYSLGDNSEAMAVNPNGLNTYLMPSNHNSVSVLTFVSLPLNEVPVAGTVTYSAPDPTTGAVTVSPNFTDPDGDPLTYSVTAPTGGTVYDNGDGTFTYVPTATARHTAAADEAPVTALSDSFAITASDGTLTTSVTAVPSISPLNHAPTPAGPAVTVLGLNELGSDFVMSADGSRAYVQSYDPVTETTSLAMIDTATNAVTIVPLGGEQDYYDMGFYTPMVITPDGRHVYVTRKDSVTGDSFLAVVDTASGTMERIAFPRTAQLQASPDSQHVYGMSTIGLAILDTDTNQVRTVDLPYSVYRTLTMRPDGAGVVVTTWEEGSGYSAIVIDNDGTLTRYRLPGNVATYVPAATCPDGTHFYVTTYKPGANGGATGQNFLTTINIPAGTSNDVAIAGDSRARKAITVAPDGARVYAIIDRNTLGILDADGNPLETVELGGTYFATSISPDGQKLYAYGNPNGDYDGPSAPPASSLSIAIVDLQTNTVTTVALQSAAHGVTFSDDGAYVFAGLSDGAEVGYLSVIDTATETVKTSVPVQGFVYKAAVSTDGRYVSMAVFNDADGTLSVLTHDVETSTNTTTGLGRNWFDQMGFTGDGGAFYVGTYDYTDEWDVSTYRYFVDSLAIPPSASATSGITVGTPAAGTRVVDGAINYTDADRDTLAYSVQTGPQHGAVTIDPATGAFTYTPNASTTGVTTDSFTVIVNDGHGARVPVTVSVPVASTNIAPTVTITPITGDYATGVVTYRATGTDPDGDPLAYTVTTNPAKGSVVNNGDGTFTFTPTPAARHAASADNATYDDKWDSFTVTATDPSGASASDVATAMISPANEAPQPSRSLTVSYVDRPDIEMFLDYRDADGDPLTFTVTAGTRGTVTHIGDGNFTFVPTPVAQHVAASPTATPEDKYETVTVVANDGHGGVTTRLYTVAIKPLNGSPAVTLTQIGGTDGTTGAKTYQVNGTDPDGDTLTYTVTANPVNGGLVRNTDGTYTYTPTPAARHAAGAYDATDAQKQDSFTITADDGYGAATAATATFNISVTNNRPTVTLTQVGSVNAFTGAATFRVTGADDDGDPLTYTVTVDPAKGAVVRNTNGTYTVTPTAAALHDAALTTATADQKLGSLAATVNDAHGGVVTTTAMWTLPAKNARPTISLAALGTDTTTGAVTYRINGADADGDQLSYTVGTNPGRGSVVVNTDGTLTYTPTDAARHAASATGAATALKRDTFTIVANDGHGGTATTATTTVTISPRNAAPNITLLPVGPVDPTTGAATYRPDGYDPEGDTMTFTITARPTKGTLVANTDGTFTYTPTAAAMHAASADGATSSQQSDQFTITANDAHGGIVPVGATVTVIPKNVAPTVTVTQVGSPNGTTGAVTYRVTGADADRDTLTYTVIADPTKGTVVRNTNGTYTYTPTATARHAAAALTATPEDKQDTFTVSINDAHGGTIVTTVTAIVSPRNTAPTTAPTVNTPSTAGVVTGSVGSADADGDLLSYTVTTGPAKGTVVVDANGGFTYVPTEAAQHAASADGAPAAAKRDTFTVTVTDGYGGSKAVTVTAQIKPANANPGVTPTASAPTLDNGYVAGAVGGADADSDALTYAVVTRPGKGTLVLNPDGTFTYTPTAAARTTASRANATAAQKQDTFSIRVRDGYGGSTLVTYTVPLSLTTSGPVVISATPPSPV